jgi:hypothetical protein
LCHAGAGRVAHPQHRILVRVAAYLGAADAHALAKRRDVRREVRARANTLGLEQRLGEDHRRPLAVRADDVDGVERPLRIAEPAQEVDHPVEPEGHAEQLERVDVPLGLGHSSAASRDSRACTSAANRSAFSRSAATTLGGPCS